MQRCGWFCASFLGLSTPFTYRKLPFCSMDTDHPMLLLLNRSPIPLAYSTYSRRQFFSKLWPFRTRSLPQRRSHFLPSSTLVNLQTWPFFLPSPPSLVLLPSSLTSIRLDFAHKSPTFTLFHDKYVLVPPLYPSPPLFQAGSFPVQRLGLRRQVYGLGHR
ncbi:hypothetical protein GALMADRAFT_1125753 [Galerina marginata CBS 339.88]|uniref:Uncharacterized protein n=1 Tax=Galerina marginata (strain CBS 339.88) TaxID=685588 RepID=A0A067TDT1_GALM3|nr:hypothetical protein GALMADRAFT_1125753 [Galerina marginata CBS 339.88]